MPSPSHQPSGVHTRGGFFKEAVDGQEIERGRRALPQGDGEQFLSLAKYAANIDWLSFRHTLELSHASHRNAGLFDGNRNVRVLTPRTIQRVSR